MAEPDPPDATAEVAGGEVTAASAEDKEQVRLALAAALPIAKLDPEEREAAQRHTLRGVYGWVLLGFLAAQVIVADVVFFLYAAWGVHWRIPAVVMSAWLGATLIEVIGVVYAVTRSLFPLSDRALLELHRS